MTGKKKILFPEYFPFIAGGQLVLLSELEHLKKDYDIRVLLFNRGTMEEKLIERGIGFDYIQAPGKVKYRYFWDFLPFSKKIVSYLEKEKPDLIYANGYFAVKLIAPASRKLKIPLIWHKHQIIERPPLSYLARQVRMLSRMASKIICVSDASRRSMIASGAPPDKAVTIRNGMEIPKIQKTKLRKEIRRKFGMTSNFVCGTVGYFRRNKGFEKLIHAAEIIKRKNKNIRFIIVGKAESDIKYEQELKELVKKTKTSDIFIFAGKQDKFRYLPAFDLFVLPSYNEPFALVVLEAMAAGVPVAAYDSGGTPEAVTDNVNGFIIKEMTPGKLAEKILEVASKPALLKKAGKNALATIRNRFTMKRQMRAIKNVVEEVLKKQRTY